MPADGYYGYGYGRRDINGKANAGLTLGIIGTGLGSGLGATGVAAPSAFQ